MLQHVWGSCSWLCLTKVYLHRRTAVSNGGSMYYAKKKMKLKNALYLILFLASTLRCFGQEAVEIINRYIDSTGGIENWKNIKTVYKESYVTFDNYPGHSSESMINSETPSLHLTHKKFETKQQKTEVYKDFQLKGRIYCHGDNCDMFIRQSKTPVRLNSDLALLKFTALTFIEWLSKKKKVYFRYVGVETIKGNSYHIVQITNPKSRWKQKQYCYFNT